MWELLRRLGVPDRLVDLITAIHDGSTASVRYCGELLESFILNSGLKQGSVFAPFLFNVFFGAIILEIIKRLGHVGIQLRYRKGDNIFEIGKMVNKTGFELIEIWAILFADDCAIVSESEEELQEILRTFVEVCTLFGQEVSYKKTEVMVVQRAAPRVEEDEDAGHGSDNEDGGVIEEPRVAAAAQPVPAHPVAQIIHFGAGEHYGKMYKNSTSFCYLGSQDDNQAQVDKECKSRIQRATYAFHSLSASVFLNNKLRLKVKIGHYCAVVRTALCYACCSWPIKSNKIEAFEVFQQSCLRRILRIKWSDKISRENVLKIAQVPPIQVWLREQRLRYLGHVQRGGDTRMTFQVLHSQAEHGKRKSGGQPTTYRSAVKDDMKMFGIDLNTWQVNAENRPEWRRMVKEGAEIATNEWIAAEHTKRETRKASELRQLEEREAAGEPVAARAAPVVDRTPRVEQLIRNLAAANEVITARHPAPIAVPRLQSRSAWINSQLREGVVFETCIEERRVHNARIVAVTMMEELIAAVPYEHV